VGSSLFISQQENIYKFLFGP